MITCQMFRKKSEEYIRHEVTDDMREALKKHMENCPDCREYLNEEIKLQKAYKEVINNNIEFNSLRSDILNSIDRNRYGKSLKARFRINILRHKGLYSGLAAACILIMLVSFKGGVNALYDNFQTKKSSVSYSQQKSTSASNENTIANSNEKKDTAVTKADEGKTEKSNSEVAPQEALPQFKKEELIEVKNQEFNAPWKTSANELLSASVMDKGSEAQEEGIGKIGVKNNKTKEMWQFSVVEDAKQYSPKYLEWWDDENILLIYGLGFGTTTRGGDLYLMDINTGKVTLIYSTNSKAAEVTKASRVNNDIQLLINVYDDDSFMTEKSHRESGIIKEYKLGQKVVIERKVIDNK